MISEKVLVVEDTRSISLFICHKIESELCMKTVPAFTFEEARRILESDSSFFIAVLDLNLPDAPDGEIVDLVLDRHIPAIVLTASLDNGVRESILSRNVVDYVVKESTWSVDSVVHAIARAYRNQSINVLLVDDSVSMRRYHRQLLETQRYRVFEAADGEDALQVLRSQGDIRLVITDFNMPRMNGLKLVSEIRKRHSKDQIAVLGLSAEGSGALSAKFLKLGANDFLKKPIVSEEFYARVNQNIEMMELLEQLRDAAIKDPLTKLFNRRYCLEAGGKLFEEAAKAGTLLSVAMVDIDFFKLINDTHGHDAGDLALKRMAELLQEGLGEPHIVGRFGGEEFLLIICGKNREDTGSLLEDIRKRVEQSRIDTGAGAITFTISTGVSTTLSRSLEGMIKQADQMLYQAKREGRNRVVFAPDTATS